MNLSKSLMALAILFMSAPAVCHAELGEAPMPKVAPKKSEGPSMEETFRWISQKFEASDLTHKYNSSHAIDHQFRASFNNCSMTYVVATSSSYNLEQEKTNGRSAHVPKPYEMDIYVVPLKDIDADPKSLNAHIFRLLNLKLTYLDANWQQESDSEWLIFFKTVGEAKTIQHFHISDTSGTRTASIDNTSFIDDVINERYVSTTWMIRVHRWDESAFGSMEFINEDAAASMVNALKHAALLCRQKKEDERAAKPSKPKDLF